MIIMFMIIFMFLNFNYMVDKSNDSEGICTYCYEYKIFYDYNDMCKFINEYEKKIMGKFKNYKVYFNIDYKEFYKC